MESLRSILIRVFAALLFVQSGLAVAHCLPGMAPGEGVTVEICSAEGMRTIRLDAEGDREAGGEAAFCPACHGLPNIALPAPSQLAGPAWSAAAMAWHGAGTARLAPPSRASPYDGRAPPAG